MIFLVCMQDFLFKLMMFAVELLIKTIQFQEFH